MARTSVEITVEGLQGVLDSLAKIEQGLDAAMLDDRVTGVLLDDANRRVPVLTGALRASGRAERGAVVYGSASVPYASAVHWGSARRNVIGQPWLSDAMNDQATQTRMTEAAERETQNLIDKEEA